MRITEKIKEKAISIRKESPIVIGFLGDSVTHGCFEIYRKADDGIETEYHSTWAYHHKLKNLLEMVNPSVTVNILNAGISGDRATGGRDRIQRDIIVYKPDLCVVCFGLNDVNNGIENIDRYETALDDIFKELKNADIETIFLTPNMIGTYVSHEINDEIMLRVVKDICEHQKNGDMDAYMDCARNVCRKNNIPVCDCYAKWKKLEQNGADITRLLANRVNHPTQEMHNIFAYSLFEMIMGF